MRRIAPAVLTLLTLALLGCSSARPTPHAFGSHEPFDLQLDRAGWVELSEPAYLAVIELTPGGAVVHYPEESEEVVPFRAGRSRLRVGVVMPAPYAGNRYCDRPGERFATSQSLNRVPPGSQMREVTRRGYRYYCYRPPTFSLASRPEASVHVVLVASRAPLTREVLEQRLEQFAPGELASRDDRIADLQRALALPSEWGGYYYELVR